MQHLTEDRLNTLNNNGYTVIRFSKYALVRKYSKYCNSNLAKRFCPLFVLVKIKENKEDE